VDWIDMLFVACVMACAVGLVTMARPAAPVAVVTDVTTEVSADAPGADAAVPPIVEPRGREVDVEKLRSMIRDGRLSGHEAMYYRGPPTNSARR
jgi:hypothetical protein